MEWKLQLYQEIIWQHGCNSSKYENCQSSSWFYFQTATPELTVHAGARISRETEHKPLTPLQLWWRWKVPANNHWSGRRHRDRLIQTTPPPNGLLLSHLRNERTVTQTQQPIHTLSQSREQLPEHFQGDEKICVIEGNPPESRSDAWFM